MTGGGSPDDPAEDRTPGTRSSVSGRAEDVVQARDVQGGIHFHGYPESAGSVGAGSAPRELPADVRGFINRLKELGRLDAVLAEPADEQSALVVSVIAGTAGVGKTSLALRWAHRVRDRFPDGQFYVNLRGYDPGPPITPEQVLDRFLRALGVAPAAIPAEPEARSALFRSLVAGRRMLIVLDNAAAVGQVRPLLPGTAESVVVVTSRSRLSGLMARDGAHRLTLDMLEEPDAVALVRAATSGHRAEDTPEELAELARLCARLPLALRIAAERAASRPRMKLADLIRDLRDESALWDALTAEDDGEADAVRTVFAWSYRALPDGAARLFCLLGLHPGPDFSGAAAAALAGAPMELVRRLLDALVGAHLLEQRDSDRYQLHDLLRAYAAGQAQECESAESRREALQRLLAWYLHSAAALQAAVNPHARTTPIGPVDPNVAPEAFSGYDDAMRWYRLERANLAAAVRAAATAGLYEPAWQIPGVLRVVYSDFNGFDEWLEGAGIALEAARALGDPFAQAEALDSLGVAHAQANRPLQALEFQREALHIRRETGDRFGTALSLNRLGVLHLRRHGIGAASELFEQSEAAFRELGEDHWTAVVQVNLVQTRVHMGDPAGAEPDLLRLLDVFRASDDRGTQGHILRTLSMALRELDRAAEALDAIGLALEIAHAADNRAWEGFWLLEAGEVHAALGDAPGALVAYQRCAAIQRDLGDRSREAQAWDGAGAAFAQMGRPREAADFHRHAAAVHRELDEPWYLARSLDRLASALAADGGDPSAVHDLRTEAVRLLAVFDDTAAERLKTRLAALLGPA